MPATNVQIYIANADCSSNVNWPSIQMTQVLTKEVSKLQFDYYLTKPTGIPYIPQLGDQVDLYVNAQTYHYFGGTIVEIEYTVDGLRTIAHVTCMDWSFKMDKKLVAKNYANMDPHDIVVDIITNFTDGSFTTNNVQKGNFLVPSIKFNYEPVSKCLQKLATVIGWDWNVDAAKDVHFFLTENVLAPITVDDTSGNQEWPTIDWDQDLTNMKNSVFVIGANYKKVFASPPGAGQFSPIDVYTSVAGTFVYPLSYPYDKSTMVIKLAGSSQTIGMDNSTPDSSVQVQYNDRGRFIRFTSDPGAGHTIQVTGTALVPIIGHASDPVAIATYGEIQDSIVDKQITTVQEAQMRAKAEILLYGHAVNTLKFKTLTAGLMVGQLITFNSVIFQAINGSSSITLTIKRITAVGYGPNNLEYQAECYGSDKVSFVDIMALLLQQENNQNPVDNSTVTETLVPINESLTLVEAVTVTSASGPYQWAPGSPNLRWGFSTWK